jgi:hypothetical protein
VRAALAWSQGADRLTDVGGQLTAGFWELHLSELVQGLGPISGPMFGFDRSGNWFQCSAVTRHGPTPSGS